MRALSAIAPLALLSACTVGPDYKAPPATASVATARGNFVRAQDAAFTPAPGLARWWESLGDPTLDGLVQDALAHSPDIDVAQARIRQAMAQLSARKADRMPSVSANGAYLHAEAPSLGGSGGSDSSLEFYNLGLNASWEVDLFGGSRRQLEQSRATLGARQADLADVQVSLSAQVAQAYVNLRDVQARVALNARSIALQEQALGLTRQRFERGAASALDIERLQAQLDNTRAQAQPLAADVDAYLDQLALLTGREPGALDAQLATAAPIPLPPAQVAIGDPASLVAHRPDIRAAERSLAASTAAIGVSEAKRLPRLNFLGLLGLGGTSPGDVFDVDKLTALGAPMLTWSFLDFGRGAAGVRQSEAERDQAEAQYRKAVLAALQDAETSLSRFGKARLQVASLARAEQSAGRSATLNNQRVTAGTSSLIDQLDIERQRLTAAIALSQGTAALTNSYVAVQKSLGLGWSEEPASARAETAQQ
ncbi:efflux transporter outer membrane subunit [Sphingobium nicotianae]|uniref:Efflux transporter outer membrane subunit n=1 Tax=Sphingobium nicotianae TaxID=2782607 RepID=A0A9X1DFL8_9SPHN|nr:efflux transporter outer membrane subunit [Sphingobium nicotianae]MBT2189052.1 efflux transporter outer membrane subunit [Sphingobium nicotianae]